MLRARKELKTSDRECMLRFIWQPGCRRGVSLTAQLAVHSPSDSSKQCCAALVWRGAWPAWPGPSPPLLSPPRLLSKTAWRQQSLGCARSWRQVRRLWEWRRRQTLRTRCLPHGPIRHLFLFIRAGPELGDFIVGKDLEGYSVPAPGLKVCDGGTQRSSCGAAVSLPPCPLPMPSVCHSLPREHATLCMQGSLPSP